MWLDAGMSNTADTDKQPPMVYVLIEQTPGEDGFLLGVFPTMAAAAAASDVVGANNGMKLDDAQSVIDTHWDSRWMVDSKTGDFVTWHHISGITMGAVIDDVRWYDIAD